MPTSAQEVQARIAALGPWFYEFDLGVHGRTASVLPPGVLPIHQTRLEMVSRVVDGHFGDRLPKIRCIDVGCHEGYYSVAMARKGVREVRGIDLRESNLVKARFVAEVLGLRNVVYEQGNCEDLPADDIGQYELCLFLGLLYHLENPMLCLRKICRVTSELCVIETQVIDEVDGVAEWGAREWTRPYHGVLALIDESGEFYHENPETGASPLATCPSPNALRFMLEQAGFRRVEFVEAPPGAYEQHRRGKRVVCAAYK
ncbi:MAG: methyltransferase domain-containing protein [Acidobacteriia bacterium]|nr:methyltransferase domain-containing protein [Terriglobia bacterium]